MCNFHLVCIYILMFHLQEFTLLCMYVCMYVCMTSPMPCTLCMCMCMHSSSSLFKKSWNDYVCIYVYRYVCMYSLYRRYHESMCIYICTVCMHYPFCFIYYGVGVYPIWFCSGVTSNSSLSNSSSANAREVVATTTYIYLNHFS